MKEKAAQACHALCRKSQVHALNWRGRGGSAAINDDSFVNMSIRLT
jgi:hypothetical protein